MYSEDDVISYAARGEHEEEFELYWPVPHQADQSFWVSFRKCGHFCNDYDYDGATPPLFTGRCCWCQGRLGPALCRICVYPWRWKKR